MVKKKPMTVYKLHLTSDKRQTYSTLLKIKEAQNHCNFVLRTKKNDNNDPPKRN